MLGEGARREQQGVGWTVCETKRKRGHVEHTLLPATFPLKVSHTHIRDRRQWREVRKWCPHSELA